MFAYGSGVFEQDNNVDMKNNMTDFIIGVNHTRDWHTLNLEQHADHYSGLARVTGAGGVTWCQDRWGARLYFNTLVTWRHRGRIKYGVINRQWLEEDLLQWSTLYTAGRLHKPVKILECDPDLRQCLDTNLHSALTTALLLLPESFTQEQLFLTIAGLSYTGDFRMIVGEDRNKVSNIVRPQMTRFRQLYSPVLDTLSDRVHCNSRGEFQQDISDQVIYHTVCQETDVSKVNANISASCFRSYWAKTLNLRFLDKYIFVVKLSSIRTLSIIIYVLIIINNVSVSR